MSVMWSSKAEQLRGDAAGVFVPVTKASVPNLAGVPAIVIILLLIWPLCRAVRHLALLTSRVRNRYGKSAGGAARLRAPRAGARGHLPPPQRRKFDSRIQTRRFTS
jgi:hypothetical protein